MSGIKTLVLDFDGVVIESAGIKKEAYRQMFEEEFPENLVAILMYQERSGGVTRRRQFEDIYEQILLPILMNLRTHLIFKTRHLSCCR